ncbi:MAG: Bax inhibitor-1 family protein [Myxococcota bacterium]
MNQQQPYAQGGNAYGQYAPTVADASVEDRSTFIVKTYAHLVGAIFAFVGLIALWFVTGVADIIAPIMVSSQIGWLVVLGGFMAVSWVAQKWAMADTSQGMQYAGLGLYVFAESLLFVPLIYIVFLIMAEEGGSGLALLGEAGVLTVLLFGALSAVVFITRKDFSFLRGAIMFGAIAAMGLIIASAIFGFELGIIFSWAMVVFAAMTILYKTSGVLHHYNTTQHVAAALNLFASFALLLWYVIRILLASRR